MIGVTRKDRKRNTWLREKRESKTSTVKEYKWRWAGHIGRLDNERWTRLTTEWQPLYGKGKQGRPTARWQDEIAEVLGTPGWMRHARDRNEWEWRGQAFAQQWNTTGYQ